MEEEKDIKSDDASQAGEKKKKKHLIHPKWLRIVLKTFMWIIIGVLLIPILLYVPPVQTFVKNVACNMVEKSTGMKIGIDRFRIKWPLDVSLKGVSVVEASGDTMVYAKEVIADIKLAPLFKLDVDINDVKLVDAGLRILSPDSSMLLKLKAGLIDIDDKSSVDIKTLNIDLNDLKIKDADLSLDMDVWKQKPTEPDTTATLDLKIRLHNAEIDGFKFGMAMLPTIDTLVLDTRSVVIRNGVIDLDKNLVTADYLGTSNGEVTYLTPTPEYIKAHPLPIDTTSVATPPMIIKGDSVSVSDFKALYAVKGAEPLPGFDPSYLQFSDVNINLENFYNEASTVKLPITSISANERSGLMVTDGNGTIKVDSLGLALNNVYLRTPYSVLNATAKVPFGVMELNPYEFFDVYADGSVGWPDVEAFMPDLIKYTRLLPARSPLTFDLVADGTLDRIKLKKMSVEVKNVFDLKASGFADNAFDLKKLKGQLTFKGDVTGPKVIDKFIEIKGFQTPSLALTGNARVQNQTYSGDFSLKTSAGDIAAEGGVSLNSEKYRAKVDVKDINVMNFKPDLGIGNVSASLVAQGAGFNPTKSGASTDIALDIKSIDYQGETLKDITVDATLNNSEYEAKIKSPNPKLSLAIEGKGTLAPDFYTFDVNAVIDKIDLYALKLSKDDSNVSGTIKVKGNASPEKWLYDIDLCAKDIAFNTKEDIFAIPDDIDLKFVSTFDKVTADIDAEQTCLNMEAESGLKDFLTSLGSVKDSIDKQVAAKDLNVEKLQKMLPPLRVELKAGGNGAIGDLLAGPGLSVDTLYAQIVNDSLITARISAIDLGNINLRADTLTLDIHQRNELLDFKLHMGNKKNNPIADFANVNLNGYLGNNRLMLGFRQQNQKGEIGYRLGLTAAFTDSIASIHFTPLKAMIGYIPWTFNSDNNLDINMKNYRINANLRAQSPKSSILLMTEPGREGNDELHLALDNIQIQDFLQLSVFAPPITASVDADVNVGYYDNWLYGNGQLGIHNFTYDKLRVGDFNLSLRAGRNDDGSTGARLGLKIDGQDAITAKAMLVPDSLNIPVVKTMELELTQFPLRIANPFLGKDVAQLSGSLNGNFGVTGTLRDPKLNGFLACDSVGVFIPMMGSSLKFNQDSILVADNVIDFNKFDIWGANNNPIIVDGTIDVSSLKSAYFDLNLNAKNFQLINNNQRARSELYGKLFMDLHATAKGPMEHFSINAGVSVLKSTDVTYSIPQTTAQLTSHNTTGIVRFVNFNDTILVMKEDTVKQSPFSMRILAGLNLEPGMQVTVIYPGSTTTGSARVELQPNGQLTYFQNYLGDMRLNGQVYLGNGFASYSMPIVGEKKFVFNPESYVMFQGDLMNPSFNISATDDVRASVIENGNSRIVNFQVGVDITNNLNSPKIEFNLDTEDDMSIRNELQSMTPDARSMAALNMLITGQYSGAGIRTASSDLLQGTMYNILTSTINGWLANNVKGVDISLGVDQYGYSENGESGSATSYSYQVSKSLFNNKFKISVGGNYTTDAAADENFSENLISDISFEYILKQTSNVTMYARLFRHTGYESILEGEITEMGGGFMLRRRLSNLKSLFKWGKPKEMRLNQNQLMGPGLGIRREKTNATTINKKDTVVEKRDSIIEKPDTITVKKVEHEEK